MKVLQSLAALAIACARAEQSLGASDDDKLFWGTYRPIPYVGLRSRAADSPLVGLMWNKPQTAGVSKVRHECSYYDAMDKYGWEMHDGVSYAKQTIQDGGNGVKLSVQWVKPDLETDPNHWVLRVEGETYSSDTQSAAGSDDEYHDLSLMWYLSTPNDVLATFDTDFITGADSTHGTYFVAYNEPTSNKNASYTDGQGNIRTYDANYFLAYNVDEDD